MVREIMDYISSCDEAVGKALYAEYHRQQRNLELIASENIVYPGSDAGNGNGSDKQVCRRVSGETILWRLRGS